MVMYMARLGSGLLPLLLALSACSDDAGGDATETVGAAEVAVTQAVSNLRGTWDITVPGFPREGVAADATAVFRAPGTRAGLTFTDGCNSATGRYARTDSGALRLLPKEESLGVVGFEGRRRGVKT